MEQELLILLGHLSSPIFFVVVAESVVFCVWLCDVIVFVHFLSFNLQLWITHISSSNLSFTNIRSVEKWELSE